MLIVRENGVTTGQDGRDRGADSDRRGGLWQDLNATTAIEYALIAGGIFLAILAAVTYYTNSVNNLFNNISNNV